jgi:AcrR family transcriptional regulator
MEEQDQCADKDRPVRAERDRAKAAATRGMLIELAAEMFAEQGYVDTSMRDIAQRASLTTGALYGHFRSKADLLAEAIGARIDEDFGTQAVFTHDEEGMRASLREFMAHFEARRRLRALIVQGAAAAQTDPETRKRLRNEQLAQFSRWIDSFENDREVLGFDPTVDLEAVSFFTWSAEIGLGILEVLGIAPSAEGWADVYDRFVRSLSLPPD